MPSCRPWEVRPPEHFVALAKSGILAQYGVEMIGATKPLSRSPRTASSSRMPWLRSDCALRVLRGAEPGTGTRLPRAGGAALIIRPSFTLGGSGGGIAGSLEQFERIVSRGLAISPVHEVLVEQSLIGWKEYELEVMRDLNDNVVIICSIENFDPMGVHTATRLLWLRRRR